MRLILSILMLVAVLARAAVPGGYMIASNDETGFEIVICTDGGTASVIVDGEGNPIDRDQPDQGEGGTCPYALVSTVVLAMEQPLPDFRPMARAMPSWASEDQRARIAIVAANAARAPPRTV